MVHIDSLKKQRGEIQARVAELAKVEQQGGSLNEEQLVEFNGLSAEFQQLTAKIERLEAAERMAAQTAQPVNLPTGANVSVAPQQRPKGFALAAMVQSLAATRGDPRAAANYADQQLHAPEVAAALNTGTGSAGGFIVPPSYVPEVIELLRPASVVRRMGARAVPMPSGTLTMPKLAGGASAEYGTEGGDATTSGPSFGQLSLSKKKLTALVPVSNDLIRFANPGAIEIVRDDVINALALREDLAFIRDNGVGLVPKGLRYWAPAGHVFGANGAVNLQNVRNDLGRLRLKLKSASVRMIKPGYLISPRTEEFLMALVDGNGNLAFPEMERGLLRNLPYATSNQIPENLGVGSDETEVYLVDFADAVIGEATGLILDISTEAAYKDGNELVSAFSRDQTLVRAITEHDFGMRHDPSVAVLTGVKWQP